MFEAYKRHIVLQKIKVGGYLKKNGALNMYNLCLLMRFESYNSFSKTLISKTFVLKLCLITL